MKNRLVSLKTSLKSAQNQSLSGKICSGSSHEIGCSLPSFFSETGLENSCEIPLKSAVFSTNLSLKILRNLTFFSATYQKPCNIHCTVTTDLLTGSVGEVLIWRICRLDNLMHMLLYVCIHVDSGRYLKED